jgi:hypothetical protein
MNYYLNGSLTVQASDGFQELPVGSSYIASAADVDVEVTVVPPGTEYAAPLVTSSPPSQIPGISNGLPTHTGSASGTNIAATNLDSDGSGAQFSYTFDAGGVLTALVCDTAGSGYKVGDHLSITTNEAHVINFRLVEGSNRAEVVVNFDATQPCQFLPFPVKEVKVSGTTARTILYGREHS